MKIVEYIGIDSIKKLQNLLKDFTFKIFFLITGRHSLKKSKNKNKICNALKDYDYFLFNDFTPNLKAEEIKKGFTLIRQGNYDVIIAIGGGSVIDMGKCISTNQEPLEDYIFNIKKIKHRGIPLIRIPTKAGSGSEATYFAVVYLGKNKHSFVSFEYLQPQFVIVDPKLTFTLPPRITASSGMDALSQAIESYWIFFRRANQYYNIRKQNYS